MMKCILSALLVTLAACAPAHSSTSAYLSTESPSIIATDAPLVVRSVEAGLPSDRDAAAWLRENAVRVRSISPADLDFSDLEPLKEILADTRIVMLGEATHGDGATFLAKTRLIKFLHQEMGFDVLAFESGLYDCRKSWELLLSEEPPAMAKWLGIFGIWARSEQVQPLIDYLVQAAATDRPLELAGFDSQLGGMGSRQYLVVDLEEFLAQIGSGAEHRESWPEFRKILQDLIFGKHRGLAALGGAPDPEAQAIFFRVLEELQMEIGALAPDPETRTASFWIQLLKSVATQAERDWTMDTNIPNARDFSLRDEQMAENLVWLAEEYYPDRKIIVWAATGHIMRNPQEIEGLLQAFDGYERIPTIMGHVVWQALGEQVYTLGFTAYEGRTGIFNQAPKDINPPDEGDLESVLDAADLEFAILDLRNPATGGEWLHRKIVARPFGYVPMRADWSRIIDGLMFIKVMTPSTEAD